MIENKIFLSLLFGHLISDFVLQSSKQVQKKDDFKVLIYHSLVVAAVNCLSIFLISPFWIPLVLFLSHLIVDYLKQKVIKYIRKRYLGKKEKCGFIIFVIDQIIHIIIIYLLSYQVISKYFHGIFWEKYFGQNYFAVLVLLIGLICATYVTSFIIPMILIPFKENLIKGKRKIKSGKYKDIRGFDYGGKIIGILERSFIFIMLLINEPAGIGFLITAKTIFRFGEIKVKGNRYEVEYILIGTLSSFILAIAISLIVFFWSAAYSNTFSYEIIQQFIVKK